jgi:hypothetical protein
MVTTDHTDHTENGRPSRLTGEARKAPSGLKREDSQPGEHPRILRITRKEAPAQRPLPTAYCRLPTPLCLLLSTYSPLTTHHSPLVTRHFALPIAHFLLPTTYCELKDQGKWLPPPVCDQKS